ncbi:MAG: penicillin-binding protein 2 [Gammaproteobacteria bacterium]|jgi:penicillin-binding protein 2
MRANLRIKDQWQEQQLFLVRTLIGAFIALLLFGALVARLVFLQVVNYDHFATLSEGNRLRLEPVAPTRGLIYDRNGVLLAENVPTYQLEITPEQVPDMAGTLKRLGRIINLKPSDLDRFHQLLGSQRRFQPVPLRTELSDEEVARFAVNRPDFPGVDIQARLSRRYPLGPLGVHALGYVGSVSETELRQLDPSEYSGTSLVGKIGVERSWENQLHGLSGNQQVETNAQGRELRVVDFNPPQSGEDLYLNLDIKVQRAADDALGDHSGAVVAIDPRNGAVVAMVSKPTYDPNLFVGGIDSSAYQNLRSDPKQPLFNRAIRGRYPPGSTVKPFLGLAGLVDGAITPHDKVNCTGVFHLEGHERPYRDWKRGGHGSTDLHKAIEQSCDVFFYDLALKLGIDQIHDFLSRFGFGRITGVDLDGELPGLLPSRQWKRRVRHQPWFPGETVITGIGQGFMLVTPMQLAHAVATLAARGHAFRPHMVKAVRDPASGKMLSIAPEPEPAIQLKHPGYWDDVIKGMVAVVNSIYGTAHPYISRGEQVTIAGKSGTAQVFSLEEGEEYDAEKVEGKLRDHALFVAFAPARNPRLAVVVVVEHGGGGSSVAAPIARKVLDTWLAEQDSGGGK